MKREEQHEQPIELGTVSSDTKGDFYAGVDTEMGQKPRPGLTDE